MKFNRRRFLQAFGASAAVAAVPSIAGAAEGTEGTHVVVVGGGFAGATAAKYLRMWSDKKIRVTLVDPNASHTSCVLSNLVLNGNITLNELKLSYDSLRSFYGVEVIRDRVTGVLPGGAGVTLKNGDDLHCDRLVIATGIDFIKPQGEVNYKETPHAWIAGSQTNLLARQVRGLSAGDTFVMTIPKGPYRCPPGPYERACVVADMLQQKGGGTVIVLDENNGIQAEEDTFSRAFDTLYRDIVDYVPGAIVEGVDSGNHEVRTSKGKYTGDVVNLIPRQRAIGFVRKAGLTKGGDGWAPVDPLTYASTLPGFECVHVIGDSQTSYQPKSAHMANAQAKVCADAIIRSLAELPTDSLERKKNITTNSACYSPITSDEASWLTVNYAYDIDAGRMMKVPGAGGEAEEWSRESYQEMFAWASNLFTDSFH